jgi:hypothetical protein
MMGMDDESMDWIAEKFKNEHMKKVEQEVKDAQNLVGAKLVSARGMGQVVVTIDITAVLEYVLLFIAALSSHFFAPRPPEH